MTVYRTEIHNSAPDFGGNQQMTMSSDIEGSGNFQTSENWNYNSATAVDAKTGVTKAYTDLADLNPNDRITVGGIELTVEQAKAVEALPLSTDRTKPHLSPNATARLEEISNQRQAQPSVEGPPVGTDGERVAFEAMTNAVAMHTGLDEDATIELGTDIALGNLRGDDPAWQALKERGMDRESLTATVSNAMELGRKAAAKEMGAPAFNELANLADSHEAVRELVIHHGIKRMNGKAKVSWNDVLDLARRWASR